MISNGSALLTGDAGSGESQIRKWILESDFVETIVRLPDDLFSNRYADISLDTFIK